MGFFLSLLVFRLQPRVCMLWSSQPGVPSLELYLLISLTFFCRFNYGIRYLSCVTHPVVVTRP